MSRVIERILMFLDSGLSKDDRCLGRVSRKVHSVADSLDMQVGRSPLCSAVGAIKRRPWRRYGHGPSPTMTLFHTPPLLEFWFLRSETTIFGLW